MARDLPEVQIKKFAKQLGATVVGIASVEAINKIVPEGYRPDDTLPLAKSVVVVGNQRYNAGDWYIESPETVQRIFTSDFGERSIAFKIARHIEREYGYESVYFGANIRDTGMNCPLSLKVCAEVAGLGTRSMAGGIILHPLHGLLHFAVAITRMRLKADNPLDQPVCPHKSCVTKWKREGVTPCMEICSAIDGKLENGRLKEVIYRRALCATRALTTMNSTYLRLLPEIISEEDPEKRKLLAIGQARQYAEDPPGRGIWGRCYECMRVCPVNRNAVRLRHRR